MIKKDVTKKTKKIVNSDQKKSKKLTKSELQNQTEELIKNQIKSKIKNLTPDQNITTPALSLTPQITNQVSNQVTNQLTQSTSTVSTVPPTSTTSLSLPPLTVNTIHEYSSFYKTPLTQSEIDFIYIYYKTNSLFQTKNYLDWDMETVVNYYKDPKIQEAIRFLKLEKNRQMFKEKMLTLEEIGSYLSNQLLEYDVAESDKLSPKEKLDASRLLLDIHKTLNGSLDNPTIMNHVNLVDFDMKLESLEVKDLKDLLGRVMNPSSNLPNSSNLSNSSSSIIQNENLLTQPQNLQNMNNLGLSHEVINNNIANEINKNKLKEEKQKEKIPLKKAKKELQYHE